MMIILDLVVLMIFFLLLYTETGIINYDLNRARKIKNVYLQKMQQLKMQSDK